MSYSTLFWDYQESKDSWKSYENDEIKTINDALKGNKQNVKLGDRTLNFAKMNEDGVNNRPIRCWVVENNSKMTWKWNEGGIDNYIPCKLMVKFSSDNQKCLKFQRNKIVYNIDVDGKKIKNEKKGVTFDLENIIEPLQSNTKSNKKAGPLAKSKEISGDSKTSKKGKAKETNAVKKDKIKESKDTKNDQPKDTNASKKGKKRKANDVDEEVDKKVAKVDSSEQKVVVTPPVDVECKQLFTRAHVFCEGNEIFDAMLNQTNIEFNNNKYYLMQILQENNKDMFYVWFRWGRVGKAGMSSLVPCGSDLEKAKKTFKQKFLDKTKNMWEEKDTFEKVKGKYDLLKMDYNHEIVEKETSKGKKMKKQEPKSTIPDSKLDERLQYLIQLICNVQMMEETVVEMNYDTKKAPLGKLTAEQVAAGYTALKKIDECLSKNQMGKPLLEACNEFYTRVPHDFGMKVPPLIRTSMEIRAKLDMLETLADIQVALSILKEELGTDIHPVDKHYNALDCNLEPLSPNEPDYQLVKRYLDNTHGQTHAGYSLTIEDIFRCTKSKDFKDVGNRMLLWHGSRLSNWAGILSQGLRIAPPEAPATGYMFGKGIYFADMVSKSANYCMASRSKQEALLVLSEVSLGKPNQLVSANSNAHKLPPGKHSVQGLGSTAPDPSMEVKMEDGMRVPLGTPINTGVRNKNGYTLNYNEYIVYDPAQVRFRFLLRVKFNFK